MKNKIVFTLIIAICIATFLPANATLSASNLEYTCDDIIMSAPITYNANALSRSRSTAMLYRTDSEGNLYGPDDYYVDGNVAYILNTANNAIYKYTSGDLSEIIDLDVYDIIGIKIAVTNGKIYVLGNDLIVRNISENMEWTLCLYDFGIDEAITDFKIYDGALYVGVADRMGGSTYIFELSNSYHRENPEVVHGYFVEKDIISIVGYADEESTSLGDDLVIEVYNLSTQSHETISVETDHILAGVQYLGKNQSGNNLIKTTEYAVRSDYSIAVSETIRVLDENDETILIRQIPSQTKSIVNQFRVIDGGVYQIESNTSDVNIVLMGTSNYINYVSYVSPLESVSFEERDAISHHDNITSEYATSISRDDIMDTAVSYHSEFEWTCTSTNIASMTGYTKPRYISGAGTYSFMPYCWGGFNSQSEFINGLENGGRAGNINTPSTGYVSNTYGLDCSGFVSKCWGRSSKYGTSTLSSISSEINVKTIKKGDVFLKSGHVMLYEKTDGNNYVLYEATQLNQYDRVAHTTRSKASVVNDGYVPYRYNNVE